MDDRPAGVPRIPLSPGATAARRPPPYFAIEKLPDPVRPPSGKARIAPAVRRPANKPEGKP